MYIPRMWDVQKHQDRTSEKNIAACTVTTSDMKNKSVSKKKKKYNSLSNKVPEWQSMEACFKFLDYQER